MRKLLAPLFALRRGILLFLAAQHQRSEEATISRLPEADQQRYRNIKIMCEWVVKAAGNVRHHTLSVPFGYSKQDGVIQFTADFNHGLRVGTIQIHQMGTEHEYALFLVDGEQHVAPVYHVMRVAALYLETVEQQVTANRMGIPLSVN